MPYQMKYKHLPFCPSAINEKFGIDSCIRVKKSEGQLIIEFSTKLSKTKEGEIEDWLDKKFGGVLIRIS